LEVQYGDSTIAIRLRCFLKHKLKDPKGKEEEEEEEEEGEEEGGGEEEEEPIYAA
jgi:hypothetical protein